MKKNSNNKSLRGAKETDGHTQLSLDAFSSIFLSSRRAVILLDEQGNIFKVNPTAKTMLSMEGEIPKDRHFLNAFQGTNKAFQTEIMAALEAKNELQIEGYCEIHDLWLRIEFFPFETGSILYVENITDIKLIQEKSTKRNELLDGILNNIVEGVFTLNERGTILSLNHSAERITGYSESDLIGKTFEPLYSRDNVSREIQIQHHIPFTAGNKIEMEFLHKSGNSFLAEIASNQAHLLDEKIYVVSIFDVTGRREQREKIEELARFPEETWNPVLKFSDQGKVNYANTRSDALLDAWSTEVSDYVPYNIVKLIDKAISTNTAQETEVKCANNQIYSVLLAPVQEANEVYVYGRDITEIKKTEADIIKHKTHLEDLVEERTKALTRSKDESERANKAKSIFLANMSHEIRTPLSAIIGFAETLLDANQNESERSRSINTIIRSGNHLVNIINDILDLSKIEAEKVELEAIPVSIFDVLSDVESLIDMSAREKGLELSIDYRFPLPTSIVTDPIRLKQILINLCGNAVKFTEKGKIEVIIACDEANEKISIEVVDSGIGMDEQQLKQIFRPFNQADSSTTRKYGGTGLGLTLSRQFALLLGGNLTVTSTKNEGSCFKLVISSGPLQGVELTDSKIESTLSDRDETVSPFVPLTGNVLLVEDTPDLQDLATLLIKKTGATVTLAENGKIAFDLAKEKEFDLILMDMQMPVMDGYDATHNIRQTGYAKPIVAMTANSMKEHRVKSMQSGCDDFLAKPLNRIDLIRALQKYLPIDESYVGEKLTSSLLEEEPELLDLVKKFVEKMPGIIQVCDKLINEKDWDQLAKEIHVLKALGGGHGFPAISDSAVRIESMITEKNYSLLATELELLTELTNQAKKGL